MNAIVAAYTKKYTQRIQSSVTHDYYFCSRHHREDGPAVVTDDYSYWYKHGKCHCDSDQPASVEARGTKLVWYHNDQIHRDNGLPAYYNRDVWRWYHHGSPHNNNGPTIVIIEIDRALRGLLLAWDGYSQVAAADFDWRQIIPRAITDVSSIRIKFMWIHGNEDTSETMRLIEMGGALHVLWM
jgi:hypothetical protein